MLTFRTIGTIAAPWRGASRWCVRRVLGLALLAVALLGFDPPAARAQGVELTTFEVVRADEGVLLSFAVAFALPKAVEDALLKGVPLHFQAEAAVMQNRWYWRDRRVAQASRMWRLTYQPLTRKFRLGFGGLNQHYDQLDDALASLRRSTRWKIADAAQLDDDEHHYVAFSFRLDTSQLPRPMQIGIGGQPEWSLAVERVQRIN